MKRSLAALGALILLSAARARAADPPPPTPANPRLVEHSDFFTPWVYDLGSHPGCDQHAPAVDYRAFSAVGFNLANTVVLIGPEGGWVVVDTLGSVHSAKLALEAIRAKAGVPRSSDGKLPIRAILYTHNHIDHTAGVQGVLELADRPPCTPENPNDAGQDGTLIARQDCVEVISQEKVVDSVINTGTVVGEIINPRSSYMYGSWLGANNINNGIGPETLELAPGFRMPSRTFSNELLLAVAGMNLKLVYVPSETDDELAVFLPDGLNGADASAAPPPARPMSDGWGGPGLLLSAEVIQGPSFPNLYSLRGTSYRNPATWFRSVDTLRRFASWGMVPAHGVPLCGGENIQRLLRNFRDAIQFTHDQAVRRMNQGHTMDELAVDIHLPEYLLNDLRPLKVDVPPGSGPINPEDYLTPFYGSVPQAVREIFYGYLGWFQADPVALDPTPPRALAARTVAAMGGAKKVNHEAAKALAKGRQALARGNGGGARAAYEAAHAELQWAAELATQVIRAETVAEVAGPSRKICAEIFSHFDFKSPRRQCPGQSQPLPAPSCQGTPAACRAREVKASAFVALAQLPTNPNWRNWYISSAQELCGLMAGVPPVVGGLVDSDIVANLPPAAWVNSWTMRLKAETTAPLGAEATCAKGGQGVHRSLALVFLGNENVSEPDQAFALDIRCAIAEFLELPNPNPGDPAASARPFDLGVSLSGAAWSSLMAATQESVACGNRDAFDQALAAAIATGGVKVLKGSAEEVRGFFRDYFDPPQATFQRLTLR